VEERFESGAVAGILHRPPRPNSHGIVLTHGAGSNANAPVLAALARAFAGQGYTVLRYDLPFRVRRPKGPPFPAQAAEDREGVRRAAAAMRALVSGSVVAGGHSYGGRQTAMAAAEDPALARSLLLLSYPLHPPDKPAQLRTAFFGDLRTPALFVQGTRDPFGSIEEMHAALALIPAPVDLIAIDGAAHDLKAAPAFAGEILTRMLF
jgi:predicted alpha/beta-hydrolase family hydrolase